MTSLLRWPAMGTYDGPPGPSNADGRRTWTSVLPLALSLLLAATLTGRSTAQTSYPMLMSLKPVAAQVGQTSEHVIASRYSMFGAYRVLVSGAGVSGEIVHPETKEGEKPNLQSMKVRFTVAADAIPGVRDFRIATPQGVSTLGQLVIGRDAVVAEAAKNDTADTAQTVEVPATICGAIEKAEDVDYYKFSVEAGALLSFHVRGMRLQNKIHDLQQHADPIITLRNAAGVTVASSDNFFFGDPFIGHHFQDGGEYLLEIRDVRYQGNRYWEYSIEVSDQPFITNVFPLAVRAGEAATLDLVGFNLPESRQSRLDVPAGWTPGPRNVPLVFENGTRSNPVPLVISPAAVVLETSEANNDPAAAQVVPVPAAVNGRIETAADIDCYAITASKGERYSFEVVARRQQSGLDSHLRILNDQGRQLQLNDDLRLGKRNFSDSWIENWTAPADGTYVIELRDLHLRGGAEFVYTLNVQRAEPYFELFADTDKTQLTPGTSGILFVRAERKNGFDGDIQLAIDGLPAGVEAQCGRILAGKGQDGCIVLTAKPDAILDVTDVVIRGTAMTADGQGTLENQAVVYQETYQPGGGRGHWPVGSHTVAVGAPADLLAVELDSYDVTLKPGESKQIGVTIRRAEGFDKNVTLDVIFKHLNSVYGNSLPAGVSLDGNASKTLLTKGATAGHITLKAAADAPEVSNQQIAVMANVSINFVMKATYCSRPVMISVQK